MIMNKANYELQNMRYRGSIESPKYNSDFKALEYNVNQMTELSLKNTERLVSNAPILMNENYQLNNTIRHLENKMKLIKEYIQRGL